MFCAVLECFSFHCRNIDFAVAGQKFNFSLREDQNDLKALLPVLVVGNGG